ncbi:AAA family ATPase [Aeromonas rivuli]|uniref:AAA family ATPase n=1 Tax=Aeromonas rivuli TaxID=648794 RepID=UPI001CCD9143|nr:AAA family ATPase [Aeromonas rivuli]UBO72805.1 AAA family ATPase [Aeromonas rivuli]
MQISIYTKTLGMIFHFKHNIIYLFLSGYRAKDGEPIRIGEVKILKKEQTEEDGIQLKCGDLAFLNKDFCSLGQSLDYYERISSLNEDEKIFILNALNDVIYNPQIKKSFENEPGWKISLMRGISESDDIFLLSPYLISKDYSSIPSIELKLSFYNESMKKPVVFDFDSPSYGYFENEKLPCRINVLVGQNGSGKSSILSKISRVAFSSSKDRTSKALTKVGTIEPLGIGFPKIISVSYSAFDSFKIPGVSLGEKKQILSDIVSNRGRYIFCGIRDINKELEDYIKRFSNVEMDVLPDDEIINDRLESTTLKSISTLQGEIAELLTLIERKKRIRAFKRIISILFKELSFKEIKAILLVSIDIKTLPDLFFECSTGHKFVIHSLMNIIAHAEKRSLILMDEPETHLHPPLLAVFMTAIREALREFDSFCIVATHSPIVVQETLRRHVHIVRRFGGQMDLISPEIETYGESLSTITTLVFSLTGEFTEYHQELDNITDFYIETGKKDSPETIYNNIESAFGNDLSMQARSYVMSRIIASHRGL